jgi:4-diphosphocytidyl-2-C-methyl-D-erythritol kinase
MPLHSSHAPARPTSKRPGNPLDLQAPAKVNLFLEVLNKRPDGYHDIATLMVAVTLFDVLRFKEEDSGDIRLTCRNPELSTGPDNLVYRAAALLKEYTGCKKGVSIRLTKRIPLAAGLAGGSSDAAATCIGLNRLWNLGLSRKELAKLGAKLGSDVAFFFSSPAAWCTGRGEKVKPLELKKKLWFVLIAMPVGLSTARVYQNVQVPLRPETGKEIRRAMQSGDVEEIGVRLHNRLQSTAEKLCPAVREVCERVKKLDPAGVLMSGSGPSVFALCRHRHEAVRIARQLRHGLKEEANVLVVHSCP